MIICLRKKWFSYAAIICVALVLTIGILGVRKKAPLTVFAPHHFTETTFIIDPGHGGEDGGAISISGKVESDINLAVSLRLDALLHFYGANTMMTRTTDISLHDPTALSLREKKVSDIHNRVDMIESVENATLISIHQNSYPEQKYRGMQVFYANEDISLPLAQHIQENVRLILDSTNNRKAAKIPNSVYLMNHISCRAVLVECGFLSNPTDDQLLQEETYQTKVAFAIAAACLNEENL